jgi:hypothetical protein
MARLALIVAKKRQNAGFTLYEVLVGLGLAGLASLAIAKTISLMNHSGAVMLTSLTTTLAQRKTSAAITRALDDLNRSRLSLGPVVLDGGAISEAKHPLANLRGTSAPRPGSDIISIVEVSPLHRGNIRETSFVNGEIQITACGFTNIPLSAAFRSYIAVGSTEIFQLVGDVRPITDSCAVLEGTAITGVISRTGPSPQGFITLWGVVREYSLFVDKSGSFRIASHVGNRILENQPITRGLRSLSLKIVPSGSVRFFQIAVSAPGTKTLATLTPSLFIERPTWEEVWS